MNKKTKKRLPDVHLAAAKKLIPKYKKKKNCKKCFDRGYVGITDDNMLAICSRCVDEKEMLKEWREYVKKFPELVELYGDSLEDGKEDKKTEEKTDAQKKDDLRKNHPAFTS